MTIERDVDEAVDRILGRRASTEARKELRSHLVDGARAHGGVQSAIRAAGGEAELARAFGDTRLAATRASRFALNSFLVYRLVGAILGVGAAFYAILQSGTVSWPVALALLAVGATLLAVPCVVHVLRRTDLAARERLAWLVALLALEPVSGITYVVLGREGSRNLARQVLA
jgi:hypothetical protein